MNDDALRQVDAFITPGTLLKAARESQELSKREAEDRLNLMPGYVDILERDDYQALRSPAFGRGYVKAYGKMLGLDEEQLLGAFDRQREAAGAAEERMIRTRPLQLQRTGMGVVLSLLVFLLLLLALWWWHNGRDPAASGVAGGTVFEGVTQAHARAGER